MRTLFLFVIVITMTTIALTQSSPVPQAIADPKQLTSKPNAQVERTLTIEKLYVTRALSGTAWSPDGKKVPSTSNMRGRNNLGFVSAEVGCPTKLTISNQRQAAPAWSPDGKWIAYHSDCDGDEQWD